MTKYLEDKAFETLNSAASSSGMPVHLARAAADWAQEWRTSYCEFPSAQANRKGDDSLKSKTVD